MAFIPGLYPFAESKKTYGLDEFRIRTDGLYLMKLAPFETGHSLDYVRQNTANIGDLRTSNISKWNDYIPISCADLNVNLLRKLMPTEELAVKYRILRAMQRECDSQKYRAPVVKAILQNKDTGALLFVTGIQCKPEEECMPAIAEGWYIFRKDMVAPLGFWEMVRDCL